MDKSIFEAFLLRTAIPKVTDDAYIPEDLGGKTNLLWDCIWRAHRDVLAGYRYAKEEFYRAYADQDARIKVNKIDERLYGLISNESCVLGSETLIKELYEEFGSADEAKELMSEKTTTFGAIQKLVNMTLKYILMLQSYDVQDGSLPRIEPQDCDCPLDSIILKSLKKDDAKWTQLSESEYHSIEEDIQKDVLPEDKEWGRIAYDLRNWPVKGDAIRRHDR